MAARLLGGLGLFLLGTALLTDGLRTAAGPRLRDLLVRFTGTPARAFAAGALATVLVQSSSATTVTLIGFVSAGLLTFPQAVGVVMGASLGTTGTGWLVAVLGLRVSIGASALPLVGAGALLHVFGRGRVRAIGLAAAGFGLIFAGIDALQAGMQALAERFPLTGLPAGGWRGRLVAAGLGIGLTVVTQSSSAAAATVLTALHAGAVRFEQAAALLVGAAIGTTLTGVLAAMGGGTAARRTALAHVLFNLATGTIALVGLPLFLRVITLADRHAGLAPGAVSLAAFHTAFVALGVAVFLPWVDTYARLIEWLLPERGPRLTRLLDDSLRHAPAVALDATRRTLADAAGELLAEVAAATAVPPAPGDEARRREVRAALEATERLFGILPPEPEGSALARRRVAQLHVLDHLRRLLARLPPPPAVAGALGEPSLAPVRVALHEMLALARTALAGTPPAGWRDTMRRQADEVVALRHALRVAILEQTAGGASGPTAALARLDALRWLERVAAHVWRVCRHLDDDAPPGPAAPAPAAA